MRLEAGPANQGSPDPVQPETCQTRTASNPEPRQPAQSPAPSVLASTGVGG